jgi:SPP1 family predicted phage head-tail adaptor
MTRINAGKYRHIVTFQKLNANPNSYGEIDRRDDANWEDVLTTRAGIFPISGRDFFNAMASVKTAEITHRIQLRFIKGIDSEMRIKFGNRIFEMITPPTNFQERGTELLILVKERDIHLTGG